MLATPGCTPWAPPPVPDMDYNCGTVRASWESFAAGIDSDQDHGLGVGQILRNCTKQLYLAQRESERLAQKLRDVKYAVAMGVKPHP